MRTTGIPSLELTFAREPCFCDIMRNYMLTNGWRIMDGKEHEEQLKILEIYVEQHMSYINKVDEQINSMARFLISMSAALFAAITALVTVIRLQEGVNITDFSYRAFMLSYLAVAAGILSGFGAALYSWRLYNSIAW